MKCKKTGCEKSAVTGHVYCSKVCAPLGRYSQDYVKSTSSEKTGAYTTRELGGLSRRSSSSVSVKTPPKESATALAIRRERELLDKNESGTSETWSESVLSRASDGSLSLRPSGLERIENEWSIQKMIQTAQEKSESGMPNEEEIACESSPSTEIAVSPTASLTEQLLTSKQAELASISLVNDVTERLHFQLKRLTLRADKNPIDPIEGSFQERQRVTLALKTASEIAKMIKLKLDAVKVFKDL